MCKRFLKKLNSKPISVDLVISGFKYGLPRVQVLPAPTRPFKKAPTGQSAVAVSYAPVSLPTFAQEARILPKLSTLSDIQPNLCNISVNTNDPLTDG